MNHFTRQSSTSLSLFAALLVGLAACGDSGGTSGQGGSSSSSAQGGQGTGAAGGATSTTSTTTTSGTGGATPGCATSADCAGDPNGSVCDPATGACVECTTAEDTCVPGEYCDATGACVAGCSDPSDCTAPTTCNTTTHTCVGCVADADCAPGTICIQQQCLGGCNPMHDCQTGDTCCGAVCLNLASDPDHCNACDNDCPTPANAIDTCTNGMCGMGACNMYWLDCNGDATDGCEHNTLQDGPCACTPGATQPCYYGAPGTENVGPCHAGTQTCLPSGTGWGSCTGQVLPVAELCNNNVDDDCNGTPDDVADADGDGWTYCNGDCNDTSSLINPGAFEVASDGIDNDCDGSVDNPVTTSCSGGQKLAGVTGTNAANAMDICQTTTAGATGPAKKWGLIAATLRLADGSVPAGTAATDLANKQVAITNLFGNSVIPKKSSTMAVISTGMARDANDPGWVLPIVGTTLTTAITFPGAGPLATYLAAHGGNLLPGQCAGTNCPVGTGANDSVNVRLQIRTPTNAQGFSYDFRFYSAEYQSFQCTTFNDYYLASLTSGAATIPADHNISFDSIGNAVSVNNGFFQDCGGNGKNCGPCPFGTAALAGTGFDQVNGGSTEWLTTDAPIVPGETITLDLITFDVGDHIYDTLVLLDNFRWSTTPVVLGTHQ